jgi:hypothetical protein
VRDPRNLTITQVFAKPAGAESSSEASSAIQSKIRNVRRDKHLPSATVNARLNSYAEAHLRGLLSNSADPDLRAIGAAISQRLAATPISSIKGISVASQVMVDSSQFQVPTALLVDTPVQYGVAAGQVRGPGQRPVLKVLLIVGL